MSASSWGGISVKAKLDGLWHDGSPMTHGRFSVCCRLGPAFTVSLIGSAAAGRGDAATAATATIAAAATRLVFLTPMLPPCANAYGSAWSKTSAMLGRIVLEQNDAVTGRAKENVGRKR